MESQKHLQIFIRSPDLGLPTQTLTLTLTLTPSLSLHDLKLSLLPPPLRPLSSSLYFSLNGKPLPDSAILSSSAVPPSSSLSLHLRLPGGGGDGGATGAESRDCYLNMYAVKKPDKADPNETRLSRWTTCALSAEPLVPPCVIDRLGNVFNKEALVEALIHKKLPKEFRHIRGLKDMIPIHLDEIPAAVKAKSETRFQCPISGLEFNGKYGFFAIRGCGHVLSTKAVKEVKSSVCLVCYKEFAESEKIVINGNPDEVEALREMMEEERGKVRDRREKKTGSCLSGTKHTVDDKGPGLENGKKVGGVKRFKATDLAPANATKEVFASIFTSSKKTGTRETYSCRSLPLGRN